eukprot:jgi/Chrzof1/4619/Cz14g20070.t1
MKVTHSTGKRGVPLSDAIIAPRDIEAIPSEEVTPQEVKESFLKVSNATFERFCRPYYTAGFNAYELVEAAMVSARASTTGGRSGAQIVDDTLREAAARGLNTIRMWGHTTSSLYPFQIAPGKYDERGLIAFDYVLETARKYGLQVIVSFIDNWKYYNGIDQYLDWSTTAPARGPEHQAPFKDQSGDPTPGDYGTGPLAEKVKAYEVSRHALFFSDPDAKRFYKNHVNFILNRNNSINGRVYKEDPTILAWNLINEPRCESWLAANANCNKLLQAWLEEMGAFVKTLDPNHMLTIGSEGFYGSGTPDLLQYNPAAWAKDMGQDFVANTNIKTVDFATVHAWPDNWLIKQDATAAFLDKWVQSHIAVATTALSVKKPVLFEEFGKRLADDEQTDDEIARLRDPIYNSTYASVQRAIDMGLPIAGSLFWKWAIPVFQQQALRGPYGVLPTDTTMNLVQGHADFMKRKLNSIPPRPECSLGAWFGQEVDGVRSCVNVPAVADAFYGRANADAQATSMAADLKAGKVLVFPTKAHCCKEGTGAFAQGCSS